MTELLDRALVALRALSPEAQDDIAAGVTQGYRVTVMGWTAPATASTVPR